MINSINIINNINMQSKHILTLNLMRKATLNNSIKINWKTF